MAISGTFSKDNAIKFNDVELEVSLDGGSTWANIESWATEVTFNRGEVDTANTRTLDGSNHVSTGESLGAGEVEVTCVYDEESGGPFDNINTAFTASPGLASEVRWSNSGATGDFLFTSDGGYMVACSIPAPSAEDNEFAQFSFRIVCDDVLKTVIS